MDDFIGIDIDVDPPDNDESKGRRSGAQRGDPSSSKPGPSRKRRRSATNSASASRKRPKKPKPPPDPPASLVSLLQKDTAVRSYFVSLQENLDYDVDKWKHEAARWKRLATSPSPKKNGSNHNGVVAKKKRAVPEKKANASGAGSFGVKQKLGDDDGSHIPITDEALFGDISSDSSSCSSAREIIVPGGGLAEVRDSGAFTKSDVDRRSHIFEKLKEAKVCLDRLGVSLVEIEVKTTVTQQTLAGDELDNNELTTGGKQRADANDLQATESDGVAKTDTEVERILHRKSDEKVAAEMMASLRSFIKASSFVGPDSSEENGQASDNRDNDAAISCTGEKREMSNEERMHWCRLRRQCHPFWRDGQLHVPTVYYDESDANTGGDSALQQPASVGLRLIMNALSTMELFCGDDLEDSDWAAIFPRDGTGDNNQIAGEGLVHDEDMASLQIGMRNRCHLTGMVLASLAVEITRAWALTDRANYLDTPTIHFYPADILDMDDPENENIYENAYSDKSYNRLVTMEERIGNARIATMLHHRHGNLQKAAELVVGFVISAAPSLCEEYPKLPPPLSMCILEALLSPVDYIPKSNTDDNLAHGSQTWFEEHIQEMFAVPCTGSNVQDESAMLLLKALAYPVHVAGSIWEERSRSADDRIRDVAIIEVRAYERLMSLVSWLHNPPRDLFEAKQVMKIGSEILSSALLLVGNDAGRQHSSKVRAIAGLCCTISLLMLGDEGRIIQLCDRILPDVKGFCGKETGAKSSCGGRIENALFLLPAAASAYLSTLCRKWGSMKLGNASGRHTASAFTVQDKLSPVLESITTHVSPEDWSTIEVAVQCCVLLGDGRSMQRLANKVIPGLTHLIMPLEDETSMAIHERKLISRSMALFIDAGELPVVRVINLKRRPDRLLDFMGCAVHKEQLIVMKGPARLRPKSVFTTSENAKNSPTSSEKDEEQSGDFAFDGQCSDAELESQLRRQLGGKGRLSDFVAEEWRPGELKAFDRDARDDFEPVPSSTTEKACALSHIASWMGVESTLSQITLTTGNDYGHEWYQKKLLNVFKISGFARGDALLHENDGMDPVPVCVILEDDAVLHDRFAERLECLLEELPRDFHFCSLGYSRPKAAPMVEYSAHLGIPSCLWYLTGYIISLEGARHLIQSLPVTGPVDSWMGLKMCSNWDNKFGDLMGVGKNLFAKAKVNLPSRKDLAKIMKFRAFAALDPLCEQKVGTTAAFALTRGGWRDKDSDIVYSG